MMKAPLLLLCICWLSAACAQPFSIGHSTITFNDPGRTGGYGSGGGPGRQIQCEVYYPSATAGNNVPIASGTFPIVVFGHGFVMAWDAYQNIWEHYVPQGYLLVFPRTEGSFSPDHEDFSKDLVVAAQRMEELMMNGVSPYNGAWNGKTGVMGHSMGGGATFLAASDPAATFDAVVGMAPAETTPSAIAAAPGVHAPTLVFSGTSDAVSPPADHHIPIYNAVPGTLCKQFVAITGGAHCYFANSNAVCDFGESTSGGNITIDRAEQHAIVFGLLDPWLSFYLKGNCPDWTVFLDVLATDQRIVGQNDCAYQLPAAPVITQNGSQLSTSAVLPVQWSLDGSVLTGETGQSVETASYGDGAYTVTAIDANGCSATSTPFLIGSAGMGEGVSSFELYPNPVSTAITLVPQEAGPVTVTLSDAGGKQLGRMTISGKTTWPVEALSPGVYFLSSESGQRCRFVKL